MRRYLNIPDAINPSNRRADAIAGLEERLTSIWAAEYTASGGELVTVRFDGPRGGDAWIKTLFDLRPGSHDAVEDRVVAVWGLSRAEPAGTRDKGRMAGFLGGRWTATYPGRDRGHFFAHTMGGGTDINLFPQLASVNRGGHWRQLENYAAAHPGTFCFVRPIYSGPSWTPTSLEYGLYDLPPAAFRFVDGGVFPN